MIRPTFPKPPPYTDTHRTEQCKTAASGCQSLALALFGAGVLSPFFSHAVTPLWVRVGTGLAAAIFESAAFRFLRYIPAPAPKPEEPR